MKATIRVALLLTLAPCCIPIAAFGSSPASGLHWTNIGPGGGGRITCLTCDPRDPDTVYAGCDVGGFYKSTDAGRHWTICNDGLTADYVEQIVVDPADRRMLYIGGCGGVFRSRDAGRSWHWLRNGFPKPNKHSYSAPVGALAINPRNPKVLYAGIGFPRKWRDGNGLLYVTKDGGDTWTIRDGIARLEPKACFFAIAVCPQEPSILLAATDRGLFRSEDNGNTWHRAGKGLPVDAVADVAFSIAQRHLVYVTLWTPPGKPPWRGGVYRSTDGGETFQSAAAKLPHIVGKPDGAAPTTCNFLKLALDPTVPECLYAGAASWVGAGLFRTVDSGAHWQRVTRKGDNQNMDLGWNTMGGIPGIYSVAVSPVNPRRIFVGASMRLFRSDDGGSSWQQCYTSQVRPGWWSGNGLATTCIDHITVDPTDGRRLYLGYADVGLIVSEDGGRSFQQRVKGIPWHGDTAPVVVDPQHPNVLWCGMGKLRLHRGGVAKSEDFGKSWTVVGSPATGLPNATTAHLALDPTSDPAHRTLYVTSAGHGIFKSTDGGLHWRAVDDGLGSGKSLLPSCILLDPNSPRHIFTALQHTASDPLGGIYESADGAGHWQKVNANVQFPDPYDLAIDSMHPDTLFAAVRQYYDHRARRKYAGGIYRSWDGGRNWKLVLPNRFADAVLVNPRDSRIVYAGLTDDPYHDNCVGGGVMESTDGGTTWHAQNNGLTAPQVGTIVCDPEKPSVLYIGTFGNGVFRATDPLVR